MATMYEKRKAKENKTVEIISKDESTAVIPVYDRIAYDVFWNDAERKFIRVTIEYDLDNGTGRVKETKAIADSQPVAIYKMGEAINRKVLNLPPKVED